jgi:phage virion morphogenesis protein
MNLTFEIQDNGIAMRLTALAQAAGNLSTVLESIGDALANNIQMTFHDQSDPWGQGWQPLSQATIARRRKKSDKILRDTGALMNGINYQVSGDSVTVGPNVWYGMFHQFGTKRAPARPFMPIRNGAVDLPESWHSEIMAQIDAHFQEVFAN